MIRKFISIFVFIVSITGISSICPRSELIPSPCFCKFDGITCGGTTDINLIDIFKTLDRNLSPSEKHFKSFDLNNTLITELKDETFKGITFDEINIHDCLNLKIIHENAFVQTSLVTKLINIYQNEKLTSQPNNSIFKILTKFINAEKILLSYSNITEIPSNAFQPTIGYQDKLIFLTFYGNSFKTLGSRAFSSLKSLISLYIGNTSIKSIPDYAFEFEESSNRTLYVGFPFDTNIESSSFSSNSMANLRRPVDFNFSWLGSRVNYLDEKIFSPFLHANPNNSIQLRWRAFNCSDCRNIWLYNNPELLKQFPNPICSNDKRIDDPDNFGNCGKKQLSGPCHYDKIGGTIFCGGDLNVDLKAYFKSFSNILEDNKKHFNQIYLNNSAITTLEDNTFNDLTFDVIRITSCNNLSSINENAFTTTNLVTKSIIIEKNEKLSQLNTQIFKILSKFVLVEKIELRDNSITEIPSNAFEPINGHQNKLEQLSFFNEPISKIGQFAFSALNNLKVLTFNQARITSIAENAFAFEKPSTKILQIDFRVNPLMKSSVFSDKSLVNIKRPTELMFGHLCCTQQITYLDEIFLPFLLDNEKNTIDLEYEDFNCKDCRNYWLTKHQNLISRLKSLKCFNGNTFIDLKELRKCTS